MLWSLGALALVWASFVYVGYRTGVHEADELTDGHLAGVASLLLNLRTAEVAPDAELTERVPTPWLKAHDYQQSLSVVQWDAQGRCWPEAAGRPCRHLQRPRVLPTSRWEHRRRCGARFRSGMSLAPARSWCWWS